LGLLGAVLVDFLRRFGRIGDNRKLALLDREGGIGMAGADAHRAVTDGEDDLAGVALPGDLFRDRRS
jgi:hypothetical protein